MHPTPAVDQELAWACGRFFKLRQTVDQIEEVVTLGSGPIRGSEQLNDLRFAILPRAEAGAKLDHELVFTPHPFVQVIIPGAALKMPLNRAQAPELSHEFFYGVPRFYGIARCAGTTSASSQEDNEGNR